MFKLNFDIPVQSAKIDLNHPLLLIGSCFSEAIGDYLRDCKFNAQVNPFGTLFNPISIFRALDIGLGKCELRPLVQRGDLSYSWDTHSQISGTDAHELQLKLNHRFREVGEFLTDARWIMVTLGTSFVYELQATGEVVANCHKFPQQDFKKRLLSTAEILDKFDETQKALLAINPEAQWLFTISPVRHLKDGLIENNHSKAILMQSVSELTSRYSHCHYFPSYEIIMDELRDYRFYKEDMIHPNELAINYVWNALLETCMNEGAQAFCQQWKPLLSALRHRAQHPESAEHQRFLNATLLKLKELENKVDITTELELIKAQKIER